MKRADDCSLSRKQRSLIRKHARVALENANAMGVFPTPVSAIMEKAQVILANEDALAQSFLEKMRQKAGSALPRAISKVIGVLDVVARVIYIDQTLFVVKQTFLKLHETAHAVLPWQRDIYAVTEECEKTLAPEISEAFEREANVFASDVLFQLDAFTNEANDHDFGIKVPLNLHKKFGASIYSAVRRYVSENHRSCAVIVLNPPTLSDGQGFSASLRRVVVSEQFAAQFGKLSWPSLFTSGDEIGAMIPVGRRMSRPRQLYLVDRNGARHECIAEAFTQTHQVFVLIHAVRKLTCATVALA